MSNVNKFIWNDYTSSFVPYYSLEEFKRKYLVTPGDTDKGTAASGDRQSSSSRVERDPIKK